MNALYLTLLPPLGILFPDAALVVSAREPKTVTPRDSSCAALLFPYSENLSGGDVSSPMICRLISSSSVGDLTFSLSSAILFSEKLRDVERAPPVTAEGTPPPVISPAFALD